MGTIAESSPSDEEKKKSRSTLRSRLSEIGSTYSAHFHQSIDSLQDAKSELAAVYEDKVKEGINFASSHPWITGGVVIGLWKLRNILKRSMRVALAKEEQMIRERTKLRQAGKEIQDVIRPPNKIERQAAGLKDILQELPTKEASRFRSQVTDLDEGGYKKQ